MTKRGGSPKKRKRRGGGVSSARRASSAEDRDRINTRRTDTRRTLAASPADDIDLWVPPTREKKPVVGNRFSARELLKSHPEVPTDDLFIPPVRSKKWTARELGFNAKGVCLFGCDGMRSLKYPDIAMHHYKCPFWDTVDGQTKTPF